MLWLAADDANGSLCERVRIVILPASIDQGCERGKQGSERGGENSAIEASFGSSTRYHRRKQPSKKRIERKEGR